MYNNPLHRYCDKCWTVRPDWLTEEMTTGKSSSSRGIETKDYFCLAERSKDKNEGENVFSEHFGKLYYRLVYYKSEDQNAWET